MAFERWFLDPYPFIDVSFTSLTSCYTIKLWNVY